MCGGTSVGSRGPGDNGGLSPRVRGNPSRHWSHWQQAWSIPACAGEPERVRQKRRRPRVYPRVCGGTCLGDGRPLRGAGLSPRVRGNLAKRASRTSSTRSIPACAGEPLGDGRPLRGGAGLSPRVRGNQRGQPPASPRRRSIPACAGEPLSDLEVLVTMEVYPRVCGGTHPRHWSHWQQVGLSPRVRGNLIGETG